MLTTSATANVKPAHTVRVSFRWLKIRRRMTPSNAIRLSMLAITSYYTVCGSKLRKGHARPSGTQRRSISHSHDLCGGGAGAAAPPPHFPYVGQVRRLCRRTWPTNRESWRAFALQTSPDNADCVTRV